MKKLVLLAAPALLLAACGSDPNVTTKAAEYNGQMMKVTWSPTSDKNATVSTLDFGEAGLPTGSEANSQEFTAFFSRVTGCKVKTNERVSAYISDGRPLFLVVPKDCS